MGGKRYPRLVLDSDWDVKPCKGRQRKAWKKEISEMMLQLLNLDSQEMLAEDSNVSVFLERVDDVVRERECKEVNEGLNSKVKPRQSGNVG